MRSGSSKKSSKGKLLETVSCVVVCMSGGGKEYGG